MSALISDIADGMRAQPGRVGLACVAVAVGAVALTLLVAVLAALQQTSEKLVAELGGNVIAVIATGGDAEQPDLSAHHRRLIAANFPKIKTSSISRSQAATPGTDQLLNVLSSDANLATVRGWRISAGRFLDANDLDRRLRHAVVSTQLAAEWHWRPGNIVYLGNIPFIVVGIVEVGGTTLSGQFGDPRLSPGERLVMVPATVAPGWSRNRRAGERLDGLFLKLPDAGDWHASLLGLQNLLAAPADGIGEVSWITPESLVARVNRLKKTIAVTVGVVTALCMTLAGTTLMSLMMANVRERIAEIGLRRTLGATHGSVVGLFIAEALLISLAGCAIGAALAHALIALAGANLPVPVETGWLTWTLPVLTVLALGLLFTFGPALRAARITPAEALRFE